MKEGRALYFTPAEFAIMVELSGEARCSLIRDRDALDDGELTRAFISLFQRGLIQRKRNQLIVSGEGQLFYQIRNAPFAVVIFGAPPHNSEAMCYVGEDLLWLVELTDAILTRQYRIQPLSRLELKAWLFDVGLLDQPVLTDGDVPELAELFADELEEGAGQLLLRLENYINGGELVEAWELRKGRSGRLIQYTGSEDRRTEIYTAEALSRMLTACFGKGVYDNR